MWRAFFFAIGTMLIIIGLECLVIDSATLSGEEIQTVPVSQGWFSTQQAVTVQKNTIQPPDWIPWSSIASGAIVILYAFTLPGRWGFKTGP